MEYKFALLNYSTENIGDEVQSIAARRFLPRIDEYVDRDKLAEWEPNQPTKLIMNGWYNRDPKGWPPKNSELLKPLLTSIHVSVKDDAVREAFETTESLDYQKKIERYELNEALVLLINEIFPDPSLADLNIKDKSGL